MKRFKPHKFSNFFREWVMGFCLVFLFALGGFTSTFYAQVQDSITLQRVIVSANRAEGIPALKSVTLDSAVLKLSMNQSVGTVLQNYSPVFIKDYGSNGIQTLTFRGMSASHTKIYVNGLDVSSASLGQTDLRILPAFLFGEIGVKFGNSAFTEGPGAIGGGVLLKTDAKNLQKGAQINVGLSAGSFGQYIGTFQYGFRSKKWTAITRYIYQQAKNNFTYRNIALPESPEVKQTHAHGNLHGASQLIKFRLNAKNALSANVLAVFSNREIPPLMTAASAVGQNQKDQLTTVQLGWKNYGKASESNMVVGYTHSALDFSDSVANLNALTLNNSLQIREDYTRNLSKNLEVKSMTLIQYSEASNPSLRNNAHLFQASSLLGINGHLKKRWEFGAFIQPTVYNDAFMVLPMASVAFLPKGDKRVILGVNFSKNAHFPSLNDLYWNPGGNPDLLPEKAISGACNVQLNNSQKTRSVKKVLWSVDVAAFYGNVENWILWQPTDAGYWEAQNVKLVNHAGAESFVKMRYGQKKWNFEASASYQFVRAVNMGTTGKEDNKQLIYTPKNSANAFIRAGFHKFWMNVNYNYTGLRYITSSNSSFLPAYDLVNVSLTYPFQLKNNQQLEVQLDVNNILGTEYMSVAWRAMPGRNVMLTLKYSKK